MTISFTEEQINKLLKASMLYSAKQYVTCYKDKTWFGNHSFSQPKYKELINNYSVWLDLYPLSTLTSQNQTVLDIYGNEELLRLFAKIGIKVIHTNPMQTAGSISVDLDKYPSIDGGYDRISYDIDSDYGTALQYQNFVKNAEQFDILVAGDVIPGHTGIGADFLLALLNYAEYPSLYIMREIDPRDWHLLPNNNINKKPNQLLCYNVDDNLHSILQKSDYIPGDIDLVMFAEKGIKDTNWSVTEEIIGVDGIKRRWLYLHLFKQGQPTLDWLNPSFAAHQLISGDILQHRFNLGTSILRLDANSLLGLEKLHNKHDLWGVGHPLSVLITRQLAMLMRRLGGFTYEENNSELDNIKNAELLGPDLSYDFAMRTGYIHAIAMGDAGLLNTQQDLVKTYGINYQRLIHAMQNHDNLCYELAHFDKNPEELFIFKNEKLTGSEIKNIILDEVQSFCSVNNLPFKLSFGGIQAHFVELCAARLGITKQKIFTNKISMSELNELMDLMALGVFYNAMQPGIFQISAWDLLGAISTNEQLINHKIADGDLRWLCRSGFDLLDRISKEESKYLDPSVLKCYPVFGSLQDQINDENSFVHRVMQILQLRMRLNIAGYNYLFNITDSNEPGLSLAVYSDQELAVAKREESLVNILIVACNFSDNEVNLEKLISKYIIKAKKVTSNFANNMFSVSKFSGGVFELQQLNMSKYIIEQEEAKCHTVDN